jgi:hypothetical protein
VTLLKVFSQSVLPLLGPDKVYFGFFAFVVRYVLYNNKGNVIYNKLRNTLTQCRKNFIYRESEKGARIYDKIAVTENKIFNNNGWLTSLHQNVIDTAHPLLTVSTCRKLGQAKPTNNRTSRKNTT